MNKETAFDNDAIKQLKERIFLIQSSFTKRTSRVVRAIILSASLILISALLLTTNFKVGFGVFIALGLVGTAVFFYNLVVIKPRKRLARGLAKDIELVAQSGEWTTKTILDSMVPQFGNGTVFKDILDEIHQICLQGHHFTRHKYVKSNANFCDDFEICDRCGFERKTGQVAHDYEAVSSQSVCETRKRCIRCGNVSIEYTHQYKRVGTVEKREGYGQPTDVEYELLACAKCGDRKHGEILGYRYLD